MTLIRQCRSIQLKRDRRWNSADVVFDDGDINYLPEFKTRRTSECLRERIAFSNLVHLGAPGRIVKQLDSNDKHSILEAQEEYSKQLLKELFEEYINEYERNGEVIASMSTMKLDDFIKRLRHKLNSNFDLTMKVELLTKDIDKEIDESDST